MANPDLEKRIYQIFDVAPLSEKQNNLYVDLDSVRGRAAVLKRLSKTICFSHTTSTCQVLAGHKGCGKSTELMRLKMQLEDNYNYAVVTVDIFENLDQNDVDFPDLLIEIVRQIACQLRRDEQIELKSSYFANRLNSLKKLLSSDIVINSTTLDAGLAKVSATIKNSPTARDDIRKALEPDTSNLLNAANDIIGNAALELKKKGKAGLVILVDNLDKITIRPHLNGDCNTAEYLFVRRGAQMTAFNCHVVYTIPLSLAYSHCQDDVRKMYEGHLFVVPAAKIATMPPDSQPYEPGMELFRDIVNKRLEAANTSVEDVFANSDILDELICLTGGQPTELMTLMREAITTDGLPITKTALERARNEGRREYARMLHAEHWPIIEQVRKNGTVSRNNDNDVAFRQMLNSRAILQYVNKDEWYRQNPMVAELKLPGKPSKK